MTRSRSASRSGPMWWVIWPVSWLRPTPRSKLAEPSQSGRVVAVDGFLQPEADVMALVGAGADRLLEGEILAAALVDQRADRRVGIGQVEHHAEADLDAALQRDRVGRTPASRGEGLDDVLMGADEADIDGIAGNAVRRRGAHADGFRRRRRETTRIRAPRNRRRRDRRARSTGSPSRPGGLSCEGAFRARPASLTFEPTLRHVSNAGKPFDQLGRATCSV